MPTLVYGISNPLAFFLLSCLCVFFIHLKKIDFLTATVSLSIISMVPGLSTSTPRSLNVPIAKKKLTHQDVRSMNTMLKTRINVEFAKFTFEEHLAHEYAQEAEMNATRKAKDAERKVVVIKTNDVAVNLAACSLSG